eukprot:TRINITY_DN10427_c0_g1_i1.p1 TRINITY_DN10427_c0_g1~~TRINITY_DN10427_c0_g1_i1.p1  ORF type:complete len:561 (-),score=164.37 TRINITY_DN10427_c0_g1_i1:192-1874(-)
MKLAKKIIRRASSKSNSGKWVNRCAAPEVERQVSKVVEAVVDSPSELNDIEFPEYDPTPYGGGYDIALTYGEPLQPSDGICHPRSSSDPDSRNLEEFSYGSVIAPYGQEPVKVDPGKPRDSNGLMQPDVEERAQNGQELVQIDPKKPQSGNGLVISHVEEKPSSDGNGDWASNPVPSYGCDFWGVDIFSLGNGYGNGYGGGDYEKAMVPCHGEEERNGYEYGMEDIFSHGNGYGNGYGGGDYEKAMVPCHGEEERNGYEYGMEDIFSHGNGYGNGYGGGDYEKAMVPYHREEERNGYEYGMEDIFSHGNGYGNGYGGGDYEKAMVPYHREEERNGYEYGMEDIFSHGNGYGNGYGGGDYEKAMVPYQGEEDRNDYEYGMEEPQPEHGYGYEDLFDGWLPLARGEGDSCNPHDADKPSNGNQWNGTVDYIFGFSNPYGEGNNDGHSYGNSIYGYEKHSPVQPHHMLVEYQEPPWTPKPTFYQDYEEEIQIQTEYVSLYERHSNAQPQYGHSEYSETSWFQEPGYYEAYQEEGYPGPQYGDDAYREGGKELYYHENYSIYDE